jgi:transcriptional regulator with XRE-family HTH domain
MMRAKRYEKTLKKFGAVVKKARKKRQLSQDKLARRIGYTSGMISRWEHGLKEPGYLAVKALQRALKIKI